VRVDAKEQGIDPTNHSAKSHSGAVGRRLWKISTAVSALLDVEDPIKDVFPQYRPPSIDRPCNAVGRFRAMGTGGVRSKPKNSDGRHAFSRHVFTQC
jgi:hypothetical protein